MSDINKQLDTIIEQNKSVIGELQATNRDGRLWTREDIADYVKLSPASVSKYLLPRPSFPKPIRMAGVGSRWNGPEVKAWVGRQRGESLKRPDRAAAGRPRKST